jgi:hypothetical protein
VRIERAYSPQLGRCATPRAAARPSAARASTARSHAGAVGRLLLHVGPRRTLTEGKSDLSTRRSVPMADRLLAALDTWSTRTIYNGDEHLVFAHPQTGHPLDGSKVTERFQNACRDAGVRPIRFQTSATPSQPNSPPLARSRSARCRSSSATPTLRPPRSTLITHPPPTKSRWSTPLSLPSPRRPSAVRTRLGAAQA